MRSGGVMNNQNKNKTTMKRRLLLVGLTAFAVTPLFAQHMDFQSSATNEKSMFERVTNLEKKIDWFNLYLNMQGSFNLYINGNDFNEASFRMDQLRIEMKGNITDRIYYRYRQRLNRSSSPLELDNMPASIDYAAVGYRLNDKLSLFLGKQSTAFGGFEFDLNPIEVYQYCDLIDYMNNFMTGLDVSYWVSPQHEFRFQVLNSRNGSFRNLYQVVPEGVEMTKAPLGYVLNWNGNFWEDLLKTRWSASIFHEAKKKNWYYYALGTELNLHKFSGFFDFMYSTEDIDRTGIVSTIASTDDIPVRALDACYLSLVLHLNYRFLPKWNVFIKGMYETANIQKNNQVFEKGNYRTSWGYFAGIEYYPIEENLHFFLNYLGRSYKYTERAREWGAMNNSPQRIELGFVYQLPVF